MPDSSAAILETQQLVLTTRQSSDWMAGCPIAVDVEVMRYMTGGVPWTEERMQSFVNRQIELFSERGLCRRKLLLKPAKEMISFCGVGLWGQACDLELVRDSIDSPRSQTTPRFKSSSG